MKKHTVFIHGYAVSMVLSVLLVLPKTVIVTLAGLALFGSILNGLLMNEKHRDASATTFLVAASGFQFLAFSTAFWRLLISGVVCHILRPVQFALEKP
jgi:benzoate membrane transport protein